MRRVILHLSLRTVRAQLVRFVLTATAVVLGVAFMSGTMILTDTMGASFDRVFETVNAGVDVIVQHPATGDDPTLDHPRLPAATLERVREVPGVATAEGTVQGLAQLAQQHQSGPMSITLGMNWIAEPDLNPLELSEGEPPRDSREVVVDQATAEREGWKVGDQVTIVAEDGPQPFALVGLATFGDLQGLPGASLLATDTETAQRLFGEPGAFDALVVAGDGSVPPDQLVADVRGALDDDSLEVLSGREDTANKQADLHEDLRFFNAFLLAFAAVALFVGVFIIYNTFTIVLAQRSRELATLRLLGASRPQVLQSVLLEAGIIGIASSGIGLVLGVFTSRALRAVLVSAGLPLPAGPTVISSATVITATVVGLAVTLGLDHRAGIAGTPHRPARRHARAGDRPIGHITCACVLRSARDHSRRGPRHDRAAGLWHAGDQVRRARHVGRDRRRARRARRSSRGRRCGCSPRRRTRCPARSAGSPATTHAATPTAPPQRRRR